MDRRKEGGGGGGSPSSDNFDIHFQALCSSVEQEKLEKVRAILESQTHVNVNGVNGDGFTLLDLAFMTGNQALVGLVVHHGGKEGAFFPSAEAVSAHLLSLITESRKQVEKFNQLLKMTSTTTNTGQMVVANTLSQVQFKECEKQLTLWQKRLTTMKKLKAGFDSAGCPHAPVEVQASVTGSNCINVKVKEPEKFGNSLYTKFKIQWSLMDSFAEVAGEVEVKTVHTLEYNIEQLAEGRRYFIRASFGNPKGYGPYCASRPRSLVPSSWRNVDGKAPRISDQAETVMGLLDSLLKSRSAELSDYSVDEDQFEDGRMKKKGLLQLFQSAPKFVKAPRIGVYLTSIMFHEDKVLLTNEDLLPILEVQQDVPSSANLQADFHWFMKMCFMWPDISKLRQDMARSGSENLRSRLLAAATTMQSALGTENLGVLYYKPLKHSNGAVVLSLVHLVKSPKSLVSLSLKWAPLSKAQKQGSVEEEGGTLDLIRSSLREQILFYQVSNISVSKGLHLCYLQSHSTIDSMSVVVSNTSPSLLPYIKIRENPHVTSEEWLWLRRLGAGSLGQLHLSTQQQQQQHHHTQQTGFHHQQQHQGYHSHHHPVDNSVKATPTTNFLVGEEEEEERRFQSGPTEAQYAFGKLVQQSVVRLFQYLEISDEDRELHRIYDTEIIELGGEISIILVIPPTETVCSVTDTSMAINLNRRDLMLVPLQAWELVHLSTYHRKLLSLYAKLSSILEVDLVLARKQQREAITSHEVEAASHSLGLLLEYLQTLEDCWTGVRWIRDVLSVSRLKSSQCGLSIQSLLAWYHNQPHQPDDSQFVSGEASSLQVKSAYMFKLDTAQNWSSRKRESAASDSDTLQSRGSGSGLSRTPTTRSDPQEFGLMDLMLGGGGGGGDKRPPPPHSHHHHLTNLAQVRNRLLADGSVPPQPPPSFSSNIYSTNSTNSVDSNDNEYGVGGGVDGVPPPQPLQPYESPSNLLAGNSSPPEPNILQVYAAYETGLAQGTSVRIKVTTATTAREVVDLVIKQLNMAVILKGKDRPIYENEKLANFCLVAVIGNRERCLRDDFRPLHLQNPWKKGRLFVRMKHDLLAAIEHLSRHTALI